MSKLSIKVKESQTKRRFFEYNNYDNTGRPNFMQTDFARIVFQNATHLTETNGCETMPRVSSSVSKADSWIFINSLCTTCLVMKQKSPTLILNQKSFDN
jgi:hypothetical protein